LAETRPMMGYLNKAGPQRLKIVFSKKEKSETADIAKSLLAAGLTAAELTSIGL
jgi:hypothetical protein